MKKIFLAIPLLALCTVQAHAQRGVPVTEKPRPEYDPIGIHIGAFTVKPKLTAGVEFNDNIYATENDTESDAISIIAPQFDVSSNWSRHALNLAAGLKAGLYVSESDEDFLDSNLSLNGRLDVQRESYLTGAVGIQRLHEERTSPDASNAWKEPAEYTKSNADMSYLHGLGRTSLTAGAGITDIDYSSVPLISGASDDLRERDRSLKNVNARLAYELLPTVKPFLAGRYEWRDYDRSEARRDSDGYRLGLGTGFDLGGVTTGEIFAGYMQQDYDDREAINGAWFGLNLLWNVTELTSVQGNVQSSIKETTLGDSTGINAIDAGVRIDHELLRNLLVGAYFNYTNDDYESIDLTDTYYTVGPRVTYLVNRYLSAEASYGHETRDSDEKTREYTENIFMLSLTGKY